MRFRHLVVPLLAALALTATMLVTTPAPASAEARPRPVSLYKGEIRDTGVFWAKGRAKGWRQRFVYLERKACRTCRYRTFKKDRTGTGGAYYFRFDGRIGDKFRIYVPRGGGYNGVRKYVGQIVRDD